MSAKSHSIPWGKIPQQIDGKGNIKWDTRPRQAVEASGGGAQHAAEHIKLIKPHRQKAIFHNYACGHHTHVAFLGCHRLSEKSIDFPATTDM